MFLNIPNGSGTASNNTVLEIPTTDNGGEYKTLVRVANTAVADVNSTPSSVSTLPVTIVGTSEQTARGARRVLVKVEVPYASLQKCSCESGTYAVDNTKSGDPISIHAVLTIPKQAATDLQSDGETRNAVAVRVAVLQYLLESLIRQAKTSYLPAEPLNGSQDSHYKIMMANEGAPLSVLTEDASTILTNSSPFMRGLSLLKPFVANGTYGPEA